MGLVCDLIEQNMKINVLMLTLRNDYIILDI